jgi:hypothetical protein
VDPFDRGPANQPNKQSRRIPVRHLWLLGVVVYLAVVWLVGWDKLKAAFGVLDVRYLVAYGAIELGGQWLRALKWRVVLGRDGKGVGLFFLSRCAGYWMPMRMGELSPLLLKEHRTPRMGAWIVVDRVLEISTTLALGVVGIMALGIPARGILAGIAVAACLFVLIPLLLLTRRGLFLWIAARVREGSLAHRGALFLAAIRDEVAAIRGKLPIVWPMTVVAACMDVAAGVVIYAGFSYSLRPALLATAKCVHALAAAVPITPNATGVPFMASGALLIKVGGVPPPVVVSAVGAGVALTNFVFWTSAGLGVLSFRRRPS